MKWHPVLLLKLMIARHIITPDPTTQQPLVTYLLAPGQMVTTIRLPPIANDA